jgi:hypothetical protein
LLTTTFLYASASACVRSALNLIDRHLYGTQRRSVRATMVVNLVLPFVACAMVALFQRPAPVIWAMLFSWKAFVPAVAIQLVSYAYSNAFKRATIASVVLDAKVGELLIPLALMPWTGIWRSRDYLFYGLSFAAFAPMFWRRKDAFTRLSSGHALFVIAATVLQAIVFFLAPPGAGCSSFGDLFVFHTCVLAFRLILSIAVLLADSRREHLSAAPMTLADMPLSLARCGCFFVTQVTFVMALSQPESHLAWPILNATSLVSALAAAPLLKEKAKEEEILSIALLTGLVILRML